MILVHVTSVPATLWAFFCGQIGFLKQRGFEVHACSSPGEYLRRFAEREQIPVHAVEMSRRITPFRDLVSLGRLWRRLRKLRPQIVHAHTPKAGLLGMLAARLAGVPVRVYTIHGLPLMTARGIKLSIHRWTEKLSCRLSHQVFCVSPSIREVTLAEGLCPADKVKVLLAGSCNGVDCENRFNPTRIPEQTRRELRASLGICPSAPVIGFVGRVVRDKGVVELTAAWQRLREEFPKSHLVLVGPFEARDPLPPQTEIALRRDRRVHLVGMVSDTSPLLSIVDVCVLPSYREGLPNVPLEASAMQIPVVATRIPGCVDAVRDGTTGTLVPPYDVPALVEAIARYLKDPELRQRHGRAGRQWVLRDFQPEAIWKALCREYERLLRENGRPMPVPGRTDAQPEPYLKDKRMAA